MSDTLSLQLSSRRDLTSEIVEFTFVSPSGEDLPAFEAGAHLTVCTPSGQWRSYSLCNDDLERHRYTIAVKREDTGQGGSRSMHNELTPGTTIEARAPRNSFVFPSAPSTLLIAGGIGITPMISIFRRLKRTSAKVQLIYLSRSVELAAYAQELSDQEDVTIHYDHGDPNQMFNLWPELENPDDRSVCYCGPKPMMQSVYLQTVHWPRSQIHSEDFAGVDALGGTAHPFSLRRAKTGEVYDVPADKSILDVLRANGIAFESSCESGTCGTCQMPLVAGQALHRDLFLSDAERGKAIMPCVSRAAGEEITLAF